MARKSTALRERLVNDDREWARKHYRELGLSPDYRMLTALEDAGFSLDHTAGRVYVGEREIGNMTVSIGPDLPERLSEEITVDVEDGSGRSIGFVYPKLSTFLST